MSGRTKARLVRPVERQPMRDWLLDKLNGKEIPGLEWVQREQKIFRIKWCHGSRHGWSLKDSILFEKWAQHSGRHHDGDPKRWKANFRCALNSLKDVEEVKDMSISKGKNAFKVYRMLDNRRKPDKHKAARRRKSDPVIKRAARDTSVPEDAWLGYSLSVEACSEYEENMSSEDNLLAESESEGYQTDVQDDTSMDWSGEQRLTLPSAEIKTEIKPDDAESSTNINIPNFDKIIPDFYKIEFGKNHLLPRLGSGFKVELLKQQSPLTPILQPFKVPFQENFLPQPTTATSQKNFTSQLRRNAAFTLPSVTGSQSSLCTQRTISSTPSLSQISEQEAAKISGSPRTSGDTYNYNYLTFPETPDGSEVSHDSNSGEYIELTIYEEEVTDTPVTCADDCIVLTNLRKSSLVTSQQTTPQLAEGLEQYGVSQTVIGDNLYTYTPLTPP